jgi:hypothetical protein
MEINYNKKDMTGSETKQVSKTEEVSSPIFQKRQHWCFMKDGRTLKFDSKVEAEKALKE